MLGNHLHQRRWPEDGTRTVEQAFAEEQPRLPPPPLHPFGAERIVAVRSAQTIYVRFDLNDYSIPPAAVGRPLTLAASDTVVRIPDGAAEIARHQRTYDRQQLVLDPAHRQALLRTKRKAFPATPAGRLAQAVPESEALLDLAFAQAESAGSQTAQLLKLLDLHGAAAIRRAIAEALERTPRAPRRSRSCCANRGLPRRRWPSISAGARKLNRSTFAHTIWRPTMNSPTRTTIPSNSLSAQLQQIGLPAVPAELDDLLARAAEARRSPRQMLEQLVQAEAAERSRRSLERRLRLSGIKSFKPMADFDWTCPAKIERDLIERALTLEFLSPARNLVLAGRNGLVPL